MTKKNCSVTIDKKVWEQVDEFSKGLGYSSSQFIEGAIEYYLQNGMPESVKKGLTEMGIARAKHAEVMNSPRPSITSGDLLYEHKNTKGGD